MAESMDKRVRSTRNMKINRHIISEENEVMLVVTIMLDTITTV